MEEPKPIKVGEIAPDLVLKDQNENEKHLADYQGKIVLLSFHPLAWTPVCADQMKSLEENHERFENLNTVAFGLSVDSVPSKKAWAKSLEITKTSLLADFWSHGGVAHAFGIFRDKNGFSERANIIIDEQGKVAFVKIYPIKELPDIEEIISFIDKMNK
jgi:peroxiredoxin